MIPRSLILIWSLIYSPIDLHVYGSRFMREYTLFALLFGFNDKKPSFRTAPRSAAVPYDRARRAAAALRIVLLPSDILATPPLLWDSGERQDQDIILGL